MKYAHGVPDEVDAAEPSALAQAAADKVEGAREAALIMETYSFKVST